jgi:hypothetical protein
MVDVTPHFTHRAAAGVLSEIAWFRQLSGTLVPGKLTALEMEHPEGSIPESTFQGIRSVNREGACPGGVWVLDGSGGDRD